MKFTFNLEIRESLGIIYYKPVLKVSGSFDPEKELDELLEELTKGIRTAIEKRLKE